MATDSPLNLDRLTDAQLHALLIQAQALLLDRPATPDDLAVEVVTSDEARLLASYRALPGTTERAIDGNVAQAIIEHLPSGVLIADAQGRVLFMNEAGRSALRQQPDPGRPFAQYAPAYVLCNARSGRPLSPDETPLGRALRGEHVPHAEFLYRLQPGSKQHVFDASAAPLFTEGGQLWGAVVMFVDVTKRRQAEERRAQRHARAQAAELEVAAARESDRFKDDLLNTISHELRTPLAAIKGFASAVLAYGDAIGPTERVEALHMIDQAADRLTALIDDLLQLQRLEAGHLPRHCRSINLAEIVDGVIADMRRSIRDHDLDVEVSGDLPAIWGDERQLRQVVRNLVGNAVKFSPAGGPITLTAAPHDTAVELRVRDGGIGIPADQLTRIFDRFHRIDNSDTRCSGGLGLGLAIVRGLVEAHGGHVRAESAGIGQGSVFVVTLPTAPTQG